MSRRKLALEALSLALRTRQSLSTPLWDPICIYDAVERMDIEVRFTDIPSMEGMYWRRTNPIILVSALRPPGRQAFTCAHELGHHLLGHGTCVDELQSDAAFGKRKTDEEFIADCFAGFLLMPKVAVDRAFAARSLRPESCSPKQTYDIASWFGVGYATLIQHMRWSLQSMPANHAEELLRASPKKIRLDILGRATPGHLAVVDEYWASRTLDVQVGDPVLLPPGSFIEGDGLCAQGEVGDSILHVAEHPGRNRYAVSCGDWIICIRVSRREFVGRAAFRHLEEVEDE